jgi:hypothetical protein
MLMRMRAALWLAVGVSIAFAAMPLPIQAQVEPPPPAVSKPDAKLPEALPPDVAFGRFIALIRGHLLTGAELAAQRDWDGAQRHFSFPTEEVYGVIRADLRNYRTPPFDDALKALVRTAKARDAKRYPAALQRVEGALAAADADLKAKVTDWPRFVVIVGLEVLKTAPDEYDDAVAKGRIVRPIGYQTARGFILQAGRMIESVAGDFTGDNAAALADIRVGLAQLKQAFATVNAPKQPSIDPSVLAAIVTKIEMAADKLT